LKKSVKAKKTSQDEHYCSCKMHVFPKKISIRSNMFS
jgi:hypothetical protein